MEPIIIPHAELISRTKYTRLGKLKNEKISLTLRKLVFPKQNNRRVPNFGNSRDPTKEDIKIKIKKNKLHCVFTRGHFLVGRRTFSALIQELKQMILSG
jgi:predicted CopG family antitoxin